MKIKIGHVSNSSSTSFIVRTKEEMERFEKLNVEVFRVEDIIRELDPIIEFLGRIQRDYSFDTIPNFIFDDIRYLDLSLSYYDKLKNLLMSDKDVCITEEFDRDIAAEEHIYYEIFAGDL